MSSCDGHRSPPPQVWSWEVGHRARCPELEPTPALSGGQNSQLSGPPLPWAQARASSLSLAPGEPGEPRRGIKSIIPRDSGLGVGASTLWPLLGLPAHLQELSDCPQMGTSTAPLNPLNPPSHCVSPKQGFSCHPQARPLPETLTGATVFAVLDSVCEWGARARGWPSPSKAEVGGRGPRPSQPPQLPHRRLPPRAAQLTSFANCSSLRAPAARQGSPRPAGGPGVTAPGSQPRPAGGGGHPSPPPARIIIPVTCLPMHLKAGPRFGNTWRGRGGGHRGGRRGEKGRGARPPQKFLLPWRIPKRSCQRRPGPGPRPGRSLLPLPP